MRPGAHSVMGGDALSQHVQRRHDYPIGDRAGIAAGSGRDRDALGRGLLDVDGVIPGGRC